MTTTAYAPEAKEDVFAHGAHFAPEPHLGADGAGAVYTGDEVAVLSTERVLTMGREEMTAVIRSVRGAHLRPGVLERLPQMDDDTLRRLLFLTRRYCRNQQRLSDDVAAGVAVPYGYGCR